MSAKTKNCGSACGFRPRRAVAPVTRTAMDYHKVPRPPCAHCVKKHLAQAIVLLQESLQGYPEHRFLATGHIAEAEAEIAGMFMDIADELRQCRRKMDIEPESIPNLLPVIVDIDKRIRQPKGTLTVSSERREDVSLAGELMRIAQAIREEEA